MPECIECGNTLREGAKFCAKCGTGQDVARSAAAFSHTTSSGEVLGELEDHRSVASDPRSCPRCGKSLLSGAESCWACGSLIKTDRPTQAPPPFMAMPPLPTVEPRDSLVHRTLLVAVMAIIGLAGALLVTVYLLLHRSGQAPAPVTATDPAPNTPTSALPKSNITREAGSISSGAASLVPDERTTLAGVQFQVLRHGTSSRRYLLIHGNEYTAREALRSYLRTHSGVALLVVGTERFVKWDGATLDPNRLFSREGTERNLRLLNGSRIVTVLPQILDRLDAQRQELVSAITPQPGGLIVAPHNTSQHSIRDEIPLSNSYEMSDPRDPYSFYLCSDPNDYRLLSTSGFNAVLQNQPHGDDDGSLSRLAARLGIRYVNIETPLDQFTKQTNMIARADVTLP